MLEEGFKHKLAAILSADVVGYSRLMFEDELATIRTLSAYRDKMRGHVHENGGRVVDFIGDNMLAEFSSALKAVDCAVKIQNTLDHLNTRFAENRQMHLYGDGVNNGEGDVGESLTGKRLF
jgi:class 3 adenylate cyclase